MPAGLGALFALVVAGGGEADVGEEETAVGVDDDLVASAGGGGGGGVGDVDEGGDAEGAGEDDGVGGGADVTEDKAFEVAAVDFVELAGREALGEDDAGAGQDGVWGAHGAPADSVQELAGDVLDVDGAVADVGAVGGAEVVGELAGGGDDGGEGGGG